MRCLCSLTVCNCVRQGKFFNVDWLSSPLVYEVEKCAAYGIQTFCLRRILHKQTNLETVMQHAWRLWKNPDCSSCGDQSSPGHLRANKESWFMQEMTTWNIWSSFNVNKEAKIGWCRLVVRGNLQDESITQVNLQAFILFRFSFQCYPCAKIIYDLLRGFCG